ncbi:xylulokinase protein [Rhodobacterales bacterium HTCC2150]|nr:xylulokinase protein [Rhodobacterales bacterium HTCC2150] [Rhodobacteraceae bacterium HTCC2150]
MFLGLDLGTSGLRGLLIDENGNTFGDAQAAYDVSQPKAGHCEQDPLVWIAAAKQVFGALLLNCPNEMSKLRGIGIAGHMHGAVCLDASGLPVRPCILWNDTCAALEADMLDGIPAFHEISGNIVFPGFTAPKLVWMRKHEPELFAAIDKICLPKDYLAFWLAGVLKTEMSDAAGSSWLNVGARCWSDDLIDATRILREQLPEVLEGCDVTGQVRDDLANELGLPRNIAVVAGAADNAAAACGIGAMADGQGFVSLGTSGVILAGKDSYAPNPSSAVHTFCHAVPNHWYQMGVILSATGSLNWLSDVTGQTPASLSAGLPKKPQGPTTLRFLPYLSGERTPHNDAEIRGAFIGLSSSTDHVDMTQAVMEGVAFALRDSFEALRKTGTKLDRLTVIGGGAKSPFWVQTLANVLNRPIDLPVKGDFGAALGAARLAVLGVTDATIKDVMHPPAIETVFYPENHLEYEDAYLKYQHSYEVIKNIQ